MHSPHAIKPPPPRLNITPLIDVVFLLIIFFLVSSNLLQQEASVEIMLPHARTAQAPQPTTIILSLVDADRILWGTQEISRDDLERELTRVANERNAADKNKLGENRQISVRLRIAKNVPYRSVEQILSICARHSLKNICFAVYGE